MATKTLTPRQVVLITEEQAIELFKAIDGKSASKINVVINTDARPNKKDRVTGEAAQFLTIRKISKRFSDFNVNYANAVNKALSKQGKEANFVSQLPSYGEKNDEYNGCLVYVDGKPQLRIHFHTILEKYVVDGKITDRSKIENFLPKEKEELVKIRNIKFENIYKFYLNKKIYKIKR